MYSAWLSTIGNLVDLIHCCEIKWSWSCEKLTSKSLTLTSWELTLWQFDFMRVDLVTISLYESWPCDSLTSRELTLWQFDLMRVDLVTIWLYESWPRDNLTLWELISWRLTMWELISWKEAVYLLSWKHFYLVKVLFIFVALFDTTMKEFPALYTTHLRSVLVTTFSDGACVKEAYMVACFIPYKLTKLNCHGFKLYTNIAVAKSSILRKLAISSFLKRRGKRDTQLSL